MLIVAPLVALLILPDRVPNTVAVKGGGIAGFKKLIEAEVKAALPRLKEKELASLKSGRIEVAFKTSPAASMKKGTIVRLQGTAQVIQIVDEGYLARVDGVLCNIRVPGLDSSEARAKWARTWMWTCRSIRYLL